MEKQKQKRKTGFVEMVEIRRSYSELSRDKGQAVANFSKTEHHNTLLEFMSHFTTSTNRAFYALRLKEIQGTLNQITHLTQKTLIGYSQLPRFITTEISARLDTDQSLSLTAKALKEGFPMLINPLKTLNTTANTWIYH